METSLYIKQILQEHLLTKDYQGLTHDEAKLKIEIIKNTLKQIITAKHEQPVSSREYLL